MQTRLSLRYSGPAVDAGLMDVYEAAANMIAFSEFVVSAAKSTYGDSVDAKAEVAGFGRGSFVTDLVLSFGGPLATLFSSGTAKELLGIINEAVALWKHLSGSPPAKVDGDGGNSLSVTNNNGQILVVQTRTANLVFSDKPAEAAGRFIREALAKQGMDSVSVEAEDDGEVRRVVDVSSAESAWFMPVAPETPLFDTTIDSALVIEAPVFKDGNKWRFSDGSGSFYADIQDEAFLTKVDDGEAFAKGDSLIVVLRIQQRRQGERLVTEKTIVRVVDHRRRQAQSSLL